MKHHRSTSHSICLGIRMLTSWKGYRVKTLKPAVTIMGHLVHLDQMKRETDLKFLQACLGTMSGSFFFNKKEINAASVSSVLKVLQQFSFIFDINWARSPDKLEKENIIDGKHVVMECLWLRPSTRKSDASSGESCTYSSFNSPGQTCPEKLNYWVATAGVQQSRTHSLKNN